MATSIIKLQDSTVERIKSVRLNEWSLKINGMTVGQVETVALTDNVNSLVGSFEVTTPSFEVISYRYDCIANGKRAPKSIASFITEAIELVGDRDIRIVPDITAEDEPECIITSGSLTEDSAAILAHYCRVEVGPTNTALSAMLEYVAIKAAQQKIIPMSDLVHRSKFGASRSTPTSAHSGNFDL